MRNAGIMAALMGGGILQPEHFHRSATSKPAKECLNCTAKHFHNNAYCSAECCEKHKNNATTEATPRNVE